MIFDPPTKTETEAPTPVTNGGPADATRSWDVGEIIMGTPVVHVGYAASSFAELPTNVPFVMKINSAEWSPTYVAQAGQTWAPTNTENTVIAADINNKTYDAHYLLGNYYQWNTATAGTGGGLVSPSESDLSSASGSICPKNWQLPLSSNNIADSLSKKENGYPRLLSSYGYTFPNGTAPSQSGALSQNGFDTLLAPFYMFRNGHVSTHDGQIKAVGDHGDFWSATALAGSLDQSYRTNSNYELSPTTPNIRWVGFSVRCLAR